MYPPFIEPDVLLPRPQKAATRPYHERAHSSAVSRLLGASPTDP